MKPEAAIKKKIREYLVGRGAYYFAPVQTGMGASTLDILCCLKGRFIGIEVKVPGKQPTKRQYLTMDAIEAAGGLALWADCLEDVQWAIGANFG